MELNWADRVQKLLTQAEDPSVTPAEAQAFTAKATAIMAKYGIDKAMAESAKPVPDVVIDMKKDFDNPYSKEHQMLFSAVAKAFNCSPISLNGHTGARTHVFGYQSDIETVQEIYTMLLLHGVNALNNEEIWGNARAFRHAWWLGYINEIRSRLTEANKKVTDETPGSAIVLRDRNLAATGAMHSAYPLRRKGVTRYRNTDAYGKGAAEGRRASLGGVKVANAGRKAIGG